MFWPFAGLFLRNSRIGALARGWLCGVDGIFACEATAKIVTARGSGKRAEDGL